MRWAGLDTTNVEDEEGVMILENPYKRIKVEASLKTKVKRGRKSRINMHLMVIFYFYF